MEFLVWTYFSQFDFVGSSIYIMEVAKVNKLSLELNKMGIKHIIFTLDDVSTKTFGDSTTSLGFCNTLEILGDGFLEMDGHWWSCL